MNDFTINESQVKPPVRFDPTPKEMSEARQRIKNKELFRGLKESVTEGYRRLHQKGKDPLTDIFGTQVDVNPLDGLWAKPDLLEWDMQPELDYNEFSDPDEPSSTSRQSRSREKKATQKYPKKV